MGYQACFDWLSTEHNVKLEISLLLFSVSNDNGLQYLHGHFMLWSSNWNMFCFWMWQSSLTERYHFRNVLRGQQDLHITCNLCAAASRYKVHFLASLFIVNGIPVLLGSYISPLLERIRRGLNVCQVTLSFGISWGVMMIGNVKKTQVNQKRVF